MLTEKKRKEKLNKINEDKKRWKRKGRKIPVKIDDIGTFYRYDSSIIFDFQL